MKNIDNAFEFYSQHINDVNKILTIQQQGFKVSGSVSPVLWEVFCSLLVNKKSSGRNHGSDLIGWEVKSAKDLGSYEYQYHLNTGLSKIKEDCIVNHIFCNYSDSYSEVDVRVIKGKNLAPLFFEQWIPLYQSNYKIDVQSSERRQRFRKNISNSYVKSHGIPVLKISRGKIFYRNDDIIPHLDLEFNNEEIL